MEPKKLAKMHSALGHEVRLRIYFLLATSPDPTHIALIADVLHITRQLASHHLALLEAAELVLEQRVGNYKVFKVSDRSMLDLIDFHQQHLKGNSCATIRTSGEDNSTCGSVRPTGSEKDEFRGNMGESGGAD